ncbi:MAG TPA: hypothetical protein P5186_03240 [Candidatus Paceibacterota bacterium]|nr:hypothetical protein [Candidatus Paceibacterota bacterium]HRZ99572.1 hypothetical protein [Candidatus Paceibacterota bacterium]
MPPQPEPPERRSPKPVFTAIRRWMLVASLSLNALLCGYLAAVLIAPKAHTLPVSSPPPSSQGAQPVQPVSHDSDSTNAPSLEFRWAQMASPDLRVYAANLRAVGCPEATVCDVLRGELDRIYAARLRAVGLAAGFWETAHQQRPARLQQIQERHRLIEEKRAQARDLTGQDWIGRITANATELALVEWIIGQSTPGMTEQIMSLLQYYENRSSQINQLSLGVQLHQDLAAKEQLKSEMLADLGQFLTPDQLTEFQARFLTLQNLDGTEAEAARLADLTPFEFRQFARQLTATLEPLAEEILDLRSPRPERRQWNQLLLANLARVVDTQRTAEFGRALDHEYRGIREFAQNHQLPRQVAIQLYEIYQAAQEEKDSILANEQLSPEEKAGNYSRLAEEASEGIAALLDRHASDYLQNQGRWIQVLAQRKK